MLTPEEQLADKLRLKKLQEESDLELAKETFGKWGCDCSIVLRFQVNTVEVLLVMKVQKMFFEEA